MALHVRWAHWVEEHPQQSNALLMSCGIGCSLLLSAPPMAMDPTSKWSFLAVSLPLFFRRTAPVASALALGVISIVVLLVLNVAAVGICIWAVPCAVYTVAARSPLRARRVVFAAALVGSLVLGLTARRWLGLQDGDMVFPMEIVVASAFTLTSAAFVTVAYLAGDLARARRHRREELEDRARRLEIEREQEVRLAAQDERTRIAREMHDVVAHSLSVVIAQADGARYAAASDPQVAERTLETIAETARGSLTEMRKLLGVLRTDDAARTTPVPQLADIPELVASVRSAGLPVEFTESGTASLSPGAQLSLYRVAQEGLTNVLKHAWRASSVRVVLEHRWDVSWMEVCNDGATATTSARAPGAGHGLAGLRERVALYGGEVEAGPHCTRPDVFVVRVTIPTEEP